jgi:hypothetical protein
MNAKEMKTEIGVIASILSKNMFDKLHAFVKPEEGVIGAHYKISECANLFAEKFKNVKDWEEKANSIGLSDYEECILVFGIAFINKPKNK